MICTLDKPWKQSTESAKISRCQKENCPFDHFWGHVRRNIRKSLAAKNKIRHDDDCSDCQEIGDKPSKLIKCDKH
jgi:hypothetical protein